MTREEQIKEAGIKNCRDYCAPWSLPAFMDGARWADTNPKSPWISVTKSLPNDYEKKLVLLRNGSVKIAVLDYSSINAYKIKYYWYNEEKEENIDFKDVVAWMSISKFED